MKSLFTGNLVRLAASSPDDAAVYARWSQNPDYLRMVDTDPARPMPSEYFVESHHSPSPNNFNFRLRTLADDKLIGFVVLMSIEWSNAAGLLAIGIGEPEYWGKGYGSDALNLILHYGFQELNLYRIGLNVISYNTRAIRVYEKVGFQREGIVRGSVQRDGQRYDVNIYGILRDEWLALSK